VREIGVSSLVSIVSMVVAATEDRRNSGEAQEIQKKIQRSASRDDPISRGKSSEADYGRGIPADGR
jgi:hypothetical protein